MIFDLLVGLDRDRLINHRSLHIIRHLSRKRRRRRRAHSSAIPYPRRRRRRRRCCNSPATAVVLVFTGTTAEFFATSTYIALHFKMLDIPFPNLQCNNTKTGARSLALSLTR
jgi:hypothetical protein